MANYNNWLEHHTPASNALEQALDAAYTAGPNATATQRAQAAVRRSLAAQAGAPMYYDRVQDTPLGPLWIAVGEHGLLAIEYESSEDSLRAYLRKLGGQPLRSAAQVAAAAEQVRLYLLGDTQAVDLPVDLSHLTPFQQRVLQETRRVPRGQVRTYMQIATRLGQPKAVRAVGQALRRNPIPIVVPCHRVVASDGTLGGYGGKMRDARKLSLLKLEGVSF
ncbi:MAG: methylated-DNA--[protein]-cysteine S-methyltransferase [Anaerolineales bacterium]|jgi:methylated-DNA-[protein]-cysteine S-methyltransferase|nr:methylated-DNA--[protein]-cysteine S-methyltransferase [Anaerolineales bacterium]MCW5887224.1 methylated-DNA--[protein]-cysteine S-methyltransferase [Anaerolineales bacterium]